MFNFYFFVLLSIFGGWICHKYTYTQTVNTKLFNPPSCLELPISRRFFILYLKKFTAWLLHGLNLNKKTALESGL